MKIIPEKEEYIKKHIRDILAVNPMVSIRDMQRMIETRIDRSIGDKYLGKLMGKIRREVVIRSDRKQVNERLAEVRERNRVHIEYLERILYWRPEFHRQYGMDEPKYRDKFSAINLISQLDLALLKAEFMVGLFEKGSAEIQLTRSQSVTMKVGISAQ